ncbi:unnamed protein product [Prorocentrum cordatum]|uniref:Uncharacterized protein n=1 Tax=Prorocentrum cordatum TaxID=2364126 RepID=A0ABN9SIB2_9DINO|nr:unnamed protein product [Polarella glacialis]
MHRRPLTGKPLFPGLGKAYTLGGFSVPSEWRDYGSRETLRLEASDTWQEFMRLYRTFVKEVCAPLCGAERLVFQCPPTMRIALPGCPATIQAHCDSEYPAHWHGEVNFWLPVTPVFGTNSLWLESEPEKARLREGVREVRAGRHPGPHVPPLLRESGLTAPPPAQTRERRRPPRGAPE